MKPKLEIEWVFQVLTFSRLHAKPYNICFPINQNIKEHNIRGQKPLFLADNKKNKS